MRNYQKLKPTLPTDKRTSPRSQISTSASAKRSPRVPKITSFPSAPDDQAPDNNDLLVLSPLQQSRRGGRSARGQPTIFKPKFDSNSPMTSRNQKRAKDKASARNPICNSIEDIKTHPKCQKYVADIERIEKLKNKLTIRHAENESYYRSHYSSFLRILKEAINTNPVKIPIVVQNTKMFFEGLLQNLIGKRGKLDKANFDFEGTLRSIITSPSSTINDQNEVDSNENVFQELFDENGKKLSSRKNNSEPIDLSILQQYDPEIQEIRNLMQKLIDRHPENERYYRKHFESFLRILSEAVSTNNQKAPVVIQNTRMFFEGLLNGLLGRNGRLKTKSFDFEEKLRKVISKEDDETNDNIIQDLIDEDAKRENDEDEDEDDDDADADDNDNDQANILKFMSDIKEIDNLLQQLIEKYPENEDYYRGLYDSFMKVLNEAIKTNNEKAPSIIQNAKTFFEGLLNDQIGDNGKVEDSEFNFEERLRNILSKDDEDDSNDNVFEDLLNKEDKVNLQQYESEIKEIDDLIQQLIEKYPENEDYYRGIYDSFMKVLKEAIKTNNEKAPSIIQNAKTFFEGLLNDQIGENGKVEDSEFNFEERLRNILSQENEEEENENVFEDLLKKEDQVNLQQYESEIKEINDIVQQLIEKYPENEDYYRDLYDSFMKVLNEAIKTNNEKAPSIIQNAKTFFEGLLNDQIGENGKVEDSEFNFEERLRNILTQENEEEENENVFEDLLKKEDQVNLQQYESEIKEIEDIMQQLINKHPENEDYYRDLYETFLKLLREAISTNSEKAPIIIKNTKMFFEGLLNDQIGENGKVEDSEFNFEERLRSILSQENEEEEENVFEDLLKKEEQVNLQQYESEIKEIDDLVQQLIEKYPENEDYYRGLYDSFMKVLNEAIKTNNEKAPSIIQNAKTFFEGLLNDQIGENGKVEDSEFNFEERLRNILTQENEEEENENVFEDLLKKEEQANLQQYESEIKEIDNLVQQLIDKHPENEDYYRDLYDSFMKVLNEAIKANNEKAPSIIQNAKTFFEGLLNDQIGENGKVEDSEFNFEERLRNILTQENEEEENENVFEDLLKKEEQSNSQQYEAEIKEIENLMQQLIQKNPENEDYYRLRYDAFLRVLDITEKENSENVPGIINETKEFFQKLLNDENEKNDKHDEKSDSENQQQNALSQTGGSEKYALEEAYFNLTRSGRLKLPALAEDPEYDDDDESKSKSSILQENGAADDDQGGTKAEQNRDENEQSVLNKYESEIGEIQNILDDLIKKHPENEDYYRQLYEAFMRVIKEAAETDSPAAPEIIEATKAIFEDLLHGEQDHLDFELEDKLREILSKSNEDKNEDQNENSNENENSEENENQSKLDKYKSEIGEIENMVQDLIEQHPENEDYYRQLYEAFMRVIKEAAETDSPAAPEIIEATKAIFEDLLHGEQDHLDFELEDKLREILSKSKENENTNESERSGTDMNESEMEEIKDLLHKLIEKYPENKDYYQKLYDSFLVIVKQAAEANSQQIPGIVHVTKLFFEELLNGEHATLDFDAGEKLKEILSSVNNNDNSASNDNESKSGSQKMGKDENEEENDQSNLVKYESEIGDIQDIVEDLIKKHPENEDYYRQLYEAFMRVIKEAAETDSPAAPEIIEATKTIFEDLLHGEQDHLDFELEDKLQEILSKSNENENENANENNENANENEKENDDDDENEREQSDASNYGSEMDAIQALLNKLIEKYPENEDFYQKLYGSFIGIIQQASEAKSPQVPGIIRATKLFFEELLNGEHARIDFNIGEKLREILMSVNNVAPNSNEHENEHEHDDSANNNNNDDDDDGENPDENDANENEDEINLDKYKSEIGEIENMVQDLIEQHPENEDYYRQLYEAFMRVIKEAAETDSPAAPEIIEATKAIFEDLLHGEQDHLDFELEDKLREILSKSSEDVQNSDRSPKFEKLYPPPRVSSKLKRTSTVPNYQTIISALRFTCLPGPRFTKLVDNISATMKENKDERFVLLMASRTQKFKGIYILSDDALSAKKMWGEGPSEIKNEDCSAYSKYITNQKVFETLQVRGFTQTTDAFSLKKKVEPDLW